MNDNRPSFSKGKIGNYSKGPTGITGTSESAVTPKCEIEYSDRDGHNGSTSLGINIDNLKSKLKPDEDIYCDIDNSLSEAEMAWMYTNNHSTVIDELPPSTYNSNGLFTDVYCTSCGRKYKESDKFCGGCGNQRQ